MGGFFSKKQIIGKNGDQFSLNSLISRRIHEFDTQPTVEKCRTIKRISSSSSVVQYFEINNFNECKWMDIFS